jgi:hypothetical protein
LQICRKVGWQSFAEIPTETSAAWFVAKSIFFARREKSMRMQSHPQIGGAVSRKEEKSTTQRMFEHTACEPSNPFDYSRCDLIPGENGMLIVGL